MGPGCRGYYKSQRFPLCSRDVESGPNTKTLFISSVCFHGVTSFSGDDRNENELQQRPQLDRNTKASCFFPENKPEITNLQNVSFYDLRYKKKCPTKNKTRKSSKAALMVEPSQADNRGKCQSKAVSAPQAH